MKLHQKGVGVKELNFFSKRPKRFCFHGNRNESLNWISKFLCFEVFQHVSTYISVSFDKCFGNKFWKFSLFSSCFRNVSVTLPKRFWFQVYRNHTPKRNFNPWWAYKGWILHRCVRSINFLLKVINTHRAK